MFGTTCGLNTMKVAVSPPGRSFHLFSAGVALRHQSWYISALVSHYIPLATRTVVERPLVCALRVSLEMRIGMGVFEGA